MKERQIQKIIHSKTFLWLVTQSSVYHNFSFSSRTQSIFSPWAGKIPNEPEEHLRREHAFNLLIVHIRTPHSTKVVRIGPFVERLVPWWYHGLSVIIKPLQHRVYNVRLVLSLVHVLARILYDVKQTRSQLTRTLRWGFGWFTASNYGIFQSRGSDRVIREVDSGRSIPSAPIRTWE